MMGCLIKKRRFFLLLATFLSLGLTAAAPVDKGLPDFKSKDKADTIDAAVRAPDLAEGVALGCILPLMGRFASYGNRALEAIVLAAGLFDPQKKSPVKLLIEDTASRPENDRSAVERLVDKGAVAIIGPLGSDEAQVAAAEAQRLKIPILTLAQKEGLTGVGNYVFRNFLTGSQQVKSLVKYAIQDLQLRQFAVLYPDDGYAPEMVKLFHQEVMRLNGNIVWSEGYKIDEINFSDKIRKLTDMAETSRKDGDLPGQPEQRTFSFEAIFIPDSYRVLKMIVPQLVNYDVQGVRLLGLNGWNSEALLSTEEPGNLEGAVFTDGFFAESIYPEAIDFVDAFYAAYGREPDVMEAEVFDTVGMAVKVVKENRGYTRDQFRDRLLLISAYPGATGRTSFAGQRDAEKEAFILTVQNGKIIQIK